MAMAMCQNLGTISKQELKRLYKKIDFLGAGEAGKVYRMVNNQTEQIVALKISYEGGIREIAPSCNYESTSKRTEGIITIYEYGILEDKDYLFYTMPVLQRLPGMDSSLELNFIFELLYTIVVLAQEGIVHNDLNPGNILCKSVPYKRQYIINDRTYVLSSNILPVIIDFGEVSLKAPPDRFSEDTIWKLVGREGMENALEDILQDQSILDAIIPNLRNSDSFGILFHPIFDPLISSEFLLPGDIIKVFSPLSI